MRKILLLVITVFVSAVHSDAQILKRYTVAGADAAALITSMAANGPDGFWAQTNNQWDYQYFYTQASGKTTLDSITVTRTVKITMPNWPGYTSASACRKKNWDSMYRSLKKHEDQHALLADAVAVAIEQSAYKIEARNSVAELEIALKIVVQKEINKNDALQEKFDADTEHGKSDPTDPIILKSCQ